MTPSASVPKTANAFPATLRHEVARCARKTPCGEQCCCGATPLHHYHICRHEDCVTCHVDQYPGLAVPAKRPQRRYVSPAALDVFALVQIIRATGCKLAKRRGRMTA